MSTVTSAIASTCPAFQGMLQDYLRMCNKSGLPGSANFEFLASPLNRSNINEIVHFARGRKRVARLIYDQPILPGGAATPTGWAPTCTATTERGDLAVEYDINYDDAREFEERIDEADWVESCRDGGELIFGKIMRLVDATMTSLYAKVAEEMPPLLGGWASTVTVDADDFLNVATEKPSSADLNPAAYMDLAIAKQKTGFCAPTFIVGGTDLFRYYKMMQVGCCTADGIDALAMLRQNGEAIAYDHYIETEFGADTSIMLQLGSVQLLHFNNFSNSPTDLGVLGLSSDSVRIGWNGVILDPTTGWPLDISIKYDCNVYQIVVRGYAKPVSLPFDMFGEGSVFEGVNWATGIQVVNT